MKQTTIFSALTIIILITCLISSCKKDDPEPVVQVTIEVTAVTQNQISITTQIPRHSQESGAFLATHENPGFEDRHVIRSAQNGVLNINFGAEPGTKYYLRSYATLKGQTYLSDIVTATTHAAVLTKEASEIELKQAKVNGEIYLARDVPVHYWFEWGESQLNYKSDERQIAGEGTTSVSETLSNLSWGRDHHYRLAIRSENKTFYGEQKSFTTLGQSPVIKAINIDVDELEQISFSAYINTNLLSTNVIFSYGDTENSYPHQLSSENHNGDSVRVEFSIPVERAQIYYFRLNVSNDLGVVSADTSAVSLAFIYEGHSYKAAKIGNQYWLAENFRGLHYQNGDPIPYIHDRVEWINDTSGALCYYEHSQEHYDTYGPLYNWYAATDSRNLAPPGWRLPTFEEFLALNNFLKYLDGINSSTSGAALKAKGLEHWQPNLGIGEDNMGGDWFGFSALGAGARANFYEDPSTYGSFGAFKHWAGFWGGHDNGHTANVGALFNEFGLFQYAGYYKKYYGLSIRFIKE